MAAVPRACTDRVARMPVDGGRCGGGAAADGRHRDEGGPQPGGRRDFLASALALAVGGLVRPALGGVRFDPVLARLQYLVDRGQLPFAALRIAQHGQVLAQTHLSGAGSVHGDSIYRLHSMTKPVVAAGVMLLVEDGEVALDDPVETFVPEFSALTVLGEEPRARTPARPMQVGHLLSHSCGLVNSWGDSRVAPLYREAGLLAGAWMHDARIGGLAGFATRLAALPLEFQPGTDWAYGYGLDIAGLVIERASGQRLGDFLRRRLFAPLGMDSTGFFVAEGQAARLATLYTRGSHGLEPVADGSERLHLSPPVADSGSGGLVSTLDDYGRFADMLANGGRHQGARVMDPATVRCMLAPWQPQAPLQAALQRFGSYGPGSVAQALGGIVRLDDRAGPGSAGEYAWGGAAGTGFWSAPALGLSVTVMTQLIPAPATSARDSLRPLVYQSLSGNTPHPR